MYCNWASDPEVTKFLTWPAHSSADVSKAVLEAWVSSYRQENYYQWAIVLKEHGSVPIGSITAVDMDGDYDIRNNCNTIHMDAIILREDPR